MSYKTIPLFTCDWCKAEARGSFAASTKAVFHPKGWFGISTYTKQLVSDDHSCHSHVCSECAPHYKVAAEKKAELDAEISRVFDVAKKAIRPKQVRK